MNVEPILVFVERCLEETFSLSTLLGLAWLMGRSAYRRICYRFCSISKADEPLNKMAHYIEQTL